MVQITVFSDFVNAPTFTHMSRCSTVNRNNMSFFTVCEILKNQIVIYVIIKNSAQIFCVIKVSLLKILFILFGEMLFKQILLFSVISDIAVYPNTIIRFFIFRQIFKRNTISLLSVFRRKCQNFIVIAVVKASAVRNYMVNIHISNLKQSVILD